MDNLGEGYRYVNMILNKGQKSGYVSPAVFIDALRAAHEELYVEARSYYQQTSQLTDDAKAVIATIGDAGNGFPLVASASGMIAFPDDYRYYASMSYLKTVSGDQCGDGPKRTKIPVELLTEASWNTRIDSVLKGPEEKYPIACIRNNAFQLAPTKTNWRYSLTYWKDVDSPYFDYVLSGGAIVYLPPGSVHDGTNPDPSISSGDASRSIDIVWPEPSRFYNKVLRLLSANKRAEMPYQEGAIEMQKQQKEWL